LPGTFGGLFYHHSNSLDMAVAPHG
jgi:hypothetical protein